MKREKLREILSKVQRGESAYMEVDQKDIKYVRRFIPSERLIVLGGGHISQPLCHIAVMLGFEVTVFDDRPDFANEKRFPDVAAVKCDEFRQAIRKLQINSRDYVCVITRGHQWDGECLREILSGTHPFYLGMIASKRRIKGLYDLLESEGFDRGILEGIYSPIGLSIGAVTPTEIAVSICAELVQKRREDTARGTVETPSAKTVGTTETKTTAFLEQTNVDIDMVNFLLEEDRAKAIMLVLETRGSTPAPSGSIMAIDPISRSFGTIGGGCSEADIMGLARRIARNGGSQIVTVDMTNEVAAQEGMACGGTMEVLIEAVR